MKYLLLVTVLVLAGCMQGIVEKANGDKYKFNALLYKIDVDKVIGKDLTLEKYTSDPGETELYMPNGVLKHR